MNKLVLEIFAHCVLVPFPLKYVMVPLVTVRQLNLQMLKNAKVDFELQNLFKFFHIPQTEIAANTAQAVHSGKYLMNTSAIKAATKIR